ncbi:methyltransferase domain-containing protein [Acetobacterium paludosum]|uniref:Methyltransferase domain-containing protein n=1 Tax=Acetobacterium paludosum TaxID=52693 RepID=A0A923HQP1_9FIRM|nr:class I SAM-dependent methyltransferase [Acetobacterium paludosum]MBC3887024.1 methyltransferase domain-containing protein [Acetobacterium paludosum]
MKLQEIKEKWVYQERDVKASIEMWDSMAQQFSDYEMPTTESSNLMRIIDEKKMLNADSSVLDVGCGAGKFSFALANNCHHVTGLDLSPKMVEKATQKKRESAKKNVDFFVNDWHASDLESLGYKGKFDLVIANMTPAVRNAQTFLKLNEASKGYCVLTKPIKRIDPVSDAIKEMLEISEKKESADMEVLYAFEILWLQGILPEMYYEEQIWNMKKPIEAAYKLYANRMKSYRELTRIEENKIKDYLISISEDGFVAENVNTTITTICWKV